MTIEQLRALREASPPLLMDLRLADDHAATRLPGAVSNGLPVADRIEWQVRLIGGEVDATT